jgi:hypothetical protein
MNIQARFSQVDTELGNNAVKLKIKKAQLLLVTNFQTSGYEPMLSTRFIQQVQKIG